MADISVEYLTNMFTPCNRVKLTTRLKILRYKVVAVSRADLHTQYVTEADTGCSLRE